MSFCSLKHNVFFYCTLENTSFLNVGLRSGKYMFVSSIPRWSLDYVGLWNIKILLDYRVALNIWVNIQICN